MRRFLQWLMPLTPTLEPQPWQSLGRTPSGRAARYLKFERLLSWNATSKRYLLV
jgi:hypothetical protein